MSKEIKEILKSNKEQDYPYTYYTWLESRLNIWGRGKTNYKTFTAGISFNFITKYIIRFTHNLQAFVLFNLSKI